MKVRIKAGYGVNLADGNMDGGGESPEPIRGQVTAISLDSP